MLFGRKQLKSPPALSLADWGRRTDAALSWLRRSIEATGGHGSSHSWSPLFGWAKAYPETTGYLIETLLDYAELKQDNSLRDLAHQCANWLVSIQLASGAFPGLLAGSQTPSVFNTGMILFGLARAGSNELALRQAVQWLLSALESDSSWREFAYVPDFTPSYYTRAVWGVLKANQHLQDAAVEHAMRKALHFYAQRFSPNGAVRDWGFWPGKPAYTHTIAYTLEGFWESALLLGEKEILERTASSAERLLSVRQVAGMRTAGRYDEQWQGDYSFVCVTGHCQLSVLYRKIWDFTGDERFRQAANDLLFEILGSQCFQKNRNRFGAIPGSAPFWGPYLRLRYPNWGAKFFLDAMRWAREG